MRAVAGGQRAYLLTDCEAPEENRGTEAGCTFDCRYPALVRPTGALTPVAAIGSRDGVTRGAARWSLYRLTVCLSNVDGSLKKLTI